MEDIPFKLDLKQIKSDVSEKSNNQDSLDFGFLKKKTSLSKSQRHTDFHKNFFFNKKGFMKSKKRNKNKMKNDIPDTPHNTGQYLCHIYQENESKDNKKQKDNNNEEEDLGINFFEEDDNDDFADDYLESMGIKFNEDSKRERLMSLEGKDLENFLFSPMHSNEDKKIFKSAIILDNTENHLNLDLGNCDDSPEMKDK